MRGRGTLLISSSDGINVQERKEEPPCINPLVVLQNVQMLVGVTVDI